MAYDYRKEKDRKLKRKYGIDLKEYEAIYAAQKGQCAICSRNFETLCVDHNHKNNFVRELLCNGCNGNLGRVNEDIDLLKKMAAYLEKWKPRI